VELLLQTDLDIKRGKVDQLLALETLLVALGEKNAKAFVPVPYKSPLPLG